MYKSHIAQYRAEKTGFMIKVRESKIRSAENDHNIYLPNTKEEWFGVQT